MFGVRWYSLVQSSSVRGSAPRAPMPATINLTGRKLLRTVTSNCRARRKGKVESIEHKVQGKLVIGPAEFTSLADARSFFRYLLQKYNENPLKPVTVSIARDKELLLGLLQRHPNAPAKIGCGVDSFLVAESEFLYRGSPSVCFWVRRRDGSMVDFSISKCLYSVVTATDRYSAFQTAVQYQIERYRHSRSFQNMATCEVNGGLFPLNQCSVIYSDGATLEQLVSDFLQDEGLDLRQVRVRKVAGSENPELLNEKTVSPGFDLHDKHLKDRWERYHHMCAPLILVGSQDQ